MHNFELGDIVQDKTSKSKHRIVRSIMVSGELYWIIEGSKFFAGDFTHGGDVNLRKSSDLKMFYEPLPTFDDALTEGEIWLADHEESGQINVFVARKLPHTGVRLYHAVRGTWASRHTWSDLTGFSNFRRATTSRGENL